MNPNFGGRRVRGKKGRGAGGKRLSSGFWNATGKSTRGSSRTLPRSCYRPQSGAAWPSIHHHTRTAGGATMGWWIGGTKSISVWTMVSMNLPVVIAMVLDYWGCHQSLQSGRTNSAAGKNTADEWGCI